MVTKKDGIGLVVFFVAWFSTVFGQGQAYKVANENNIRAAVAFPGTNGGAKIHACLADLPTTGGTCEAWLEGAQTIPTDPFVGITSPSDLHLGAGTYTLGACLAPPTNSRVIGLGKQTILKRTNGPIFCPAGTATATESNLNANVSAGDLIITVLSTTGFTPGDWVEIYDNSSNATGGRHAELGQIYKIVSSTQLQLKAGTINSYDTGQTSKNVTKIIPAQNIEVADLTLDMTGVAPNSLTGVFGCTYCVNTSVHGLRIENFDTNGLAFARSYNVTIRDNWFGSSVANLDLGGDGWAVQISSSHFADISHNFFTQIKEMAWSGDSSHVDFSHNVLHGVRYGPNIHFNHGKDCKFDDNLFVGDTTNDATTDPQLYGGIIEITDPSGEAIISNNMFRNYFANGAVKINSTGTNGKVIVSNNQFINPRSIGNGAFATAIFTSGVDASIIGNQAIGFVAGMGGIFVQNATRFIISENILDANATVAGATGIKIKDSKYGSVMGNIISEFGGPLNVGIKIQSTDSGSTDQVFLAGNIYRGNTADQLIAANATHMVGMEYLSGELVLKGFLALDSTAFANLGAPANGTVIWCTDCDAPVTQGAVCTSAGTKTGAEAHRVRGAWQCY